MWDHLWINATVVTCENGYSMIRNGGIASQAGKIAWMGAMSELKASYENLAENITDVEGRCITPGLIDCHTHLIYAGNRAHEFAMRLEGKSYVEIAKAGGGIQSSVNATRAATETELLNQTIPRLKSMMAAGATTIEIKTGYGLNWETELKMLRVARKLAELFPVTIVPTFLGAHTIPSEYHGKSDAYVDLVCNEMIPQLAKLNLADAIDVFCENIAFSLEQTERIFTAAKANNLGLKCHAEQLSNTNVSVLAAKYNALSVDHLEYLSPQGIAAIKASGTVPVLLPGAYYYLREKTLPPIELLRDNDLPIALATDCNPGTSPIMSLRLIMNMACILFRLTPEESLVGVTKNAAKALGKIIDVGTLAINKTADFIVWDCQHPDELAYYLGDQSLVSLVKNGLVINH